LNRYINQIGKKSKKNFLLLLAFITYDKEFLIDFLIYFSKILKMNCGAIFYAIYKDYL